MKLSRRNLLGLLGMGAAGTAAAKFLPPTGTAEARSPEATVGPTPVILDTGPRECEATVKLIHGWLHSARQQYVIGKCQEAFGHALPHRLLLALPGGMSRGFGTGHGPVYRRVVWDETRSVVEALS